MIIHGLDAPLRATTDWILSVAPFLGDITVLVQLFLLCWAMQVPILPVLVPWPHKRALSL